jgi:hypothetical protein
MFGLLFGYAKLQWRQSAAEFVRQMMRAHKWHATTKNKNPTKAKGFKLQYPSRPLNTPLDPLKFVARPVDLLVRVCVRACVCTKGYDMLY